jgi:ABC-type sugar transport system permease subunit
VVYSIWLSLHRIRLGRGAWQFTGLDQYLRAYSDPMFWDSVKLTLIYTATTTVLTFLIAMFGALVLNEKFRGRKTLIVLTILPWALSTYATAVLWKYIYSIQLGLISAVTGNLNIEVTPPDLLSPDLAIYSVAIAHSWQMAPFGIYFLLASLQVIPPDMYKVARVDGLGTIARFRHVTMPYLRGAVMAMVVLVVLAAARVFDIIYFITNGGPSNMSTTTTFYIYLQTFRAFDIGYGSAISTLLLLGIVVMMAVYFLVFLRQQRRST